MRIMHPRVNIAPGNDSTGPNTPYRLFFTFPTIAQPDLSMFGICRMRAEISDNIVNNKNGCKIANIRPNDTKLG